MERRVEQPEAEQVRPPRDVRDGFGRFPGRLPFIAVGAGHPSPLRYSMAVERRFLWRAKQMWRTGGDLRGDRDGAYWKDSLRSAS